MKLRIKGNFLRIRLEKPEVQQLLESGSVKETTTFAHKLFQYAVVSGAYENLSASFTENQIAIHIPKAACSRFCQTDEVSLSGTDGALELLVEKDFQCLHKRPDEDESQMYANPLAKKV
jgi:hypothetical protein